MDVFGDHLTGRKHVQDDVNDFLRNKLFAEYLQWHRTNHRFHDSFESDMARQKMMRYQTYAYVVGAIAFSAVVINPNFTQRRSYYVRKFIPLMSGIVAYQYGYRNENVHMTNMLLEMNEYFPLEVRRMMQTKDFRHLQQFDYKNPGR